jgi:hypothetical protein
MKPRGDRKAAGRSRGLLLVLVLGTVTVAGCAPEPPRPKAVAPTASGAAGDPGEVAQPPRRIATH